MGALRSHEVDVIIGLTACIAIIIQIQVRIIGVGVVITAIIFKLVL